MSSYVCRYPDAAAGLALLLVRMSYAFVALGIVAMLPVDILGATFLHLVAGAVALLLVAGLATRLVALLLGIAVAIALTAADPIQQLLLAGHIGGCAAIVLTGPGAFSVDARRHGRRVILLRTNTPDRGADQ
jgi:hypothetical protein